MSAARESHSHQSRGSQTVVASIVFTAIAGVIMALRMVTRTCIVRNVGPEDWLITAAYVFSLALTILVCIEVQHGEGHHIDTIKPSELKKLLLAFWLSLPAYMSALILTKISILLQYHRVFVGQRIRRAIYAMLAICSIYGVWSVLGNIFMCLPVSSFWNKDVKGRCMSQQAVWFANAGLNIITDMLILALPMPALRQLQLPRRQKYGLMAVFALGGFVCLVSILRLRALYDVSISTDVTWDNGPAAYWSSIEVNVGIICAALPTLKALVSKFFPRLLGSPSSKGKSSSARRTDSRFGIHGTATGNTRPSISLFKQGLRPTEIELKSRTGSMDRAMIDLRDNDIRVITVVEQEAHDLSDADVESLRSRQNEPFANDRPTQSGYMPGY